MQESKFLISCDLAQSHDYTAIAVFERERVLDAAGVRVRDAHGDVWNLDLVLIRRVPRHTPYPEIVALLATIRARLRPRGGRPVLAVDATGVGAPVVDMILDSPLDGNSAIHPVLITAGRHVTRATWGATLRPCWHVPKADLVAALHREGGLGRFRVARGLEHEDLLRQELLGFQTRTSAAGNEQFGTWREHDHDDLVLATALGIWASTRIGTGACGPTGPGHFVADPLRPPADTDLARYGPRGTGGLLSEEEWHRADAGAHEHTRERTRPW